METRDKTSILIIDDDPKQILGFRELLSGMNLHIVEADSGTNGLRELLRQDFACILLDVRMPVMDGFETAKLIRERLISRSTPIIFVSAASTSELDILKGYTLGAIDYIRQPCNSFIIRSLL